MNDLNIYKDFEKLFGKRKSINYRIDYETDPVIDKIVCLMTADIGSSITFLKEKYSEEQFVWLSEVADVITAYTKSREFIHCLRELCNKYPEATKKYNLLYFIESAAEYLE